MSGEAGNQGLSCAAEGYDDLAGRRGRPRSPFADVAICVVSAATREGNARGVEAARAQQASGFRSIDIPYACGWNEERGERGGGGGSGQRVRARPRAGRTYVSCVVCVCARFDESLVLFCFSRLAWRVRW